MAHEQQVFEGGATRSAQKGRYDLLPKAGLDRWAQRMALGAEKHGENNWRGGDEKFRRATISHAFQHLADFAENGNSTDDNLGALMANIGFLCELERRKKFRGSRNATVPVTVRKRAARGKTRA